MFFWGPSAHLLLLRMFHSFCDRGEAENALDIFDREQLLAFGTETTEASEEIWAEYPRIVAVPLA